jgi:hypothetical protein
MSLCRLPLRQWVLSSLAFPVLLLLPALQAQVVPSVTSLSFSRNLTNVWPSVTSLGFGQNTPVFTQPFFPQPCCFNPFFTISVNGTLLHHHRRHHFPFVGAGLPIYATSYYSPGIVEPVDDTMAEDYGQGPGFLGRHGSNRTFEEQYDDRLQRLERQVGEVSASAAQTPPAIPAPQTPAEEQPTTALIFSDGHTMEVKNYAIVGDMLYVLSTDRRRKIALADLDLVATQKQNEDRGVDFRLPAHPPVKSR